MLYISAALPRCHAAALLCLAAALLFANISFAEKLYIVERERGGLAVIKDNKFNNEIKDLGNMNHATVKFSDKDAYLIGRDGFISKIDTATDKLIRKMKVGRSGIGFTISQNYVAVANYDPHDVVILDRDLNITKRLETGSRNVGIKDSGNLLVFSLMDRDEIWVLDESKGFDIAKRIDNAGKMPFDAFLKDNVYIAGLFKEGSVGILDLKNMNYMMQDLRKKDNETVYKIPHFGTWGIKDNLAFIPAVGERKMHIINLKDFTYIDSINLIGLPVFVAASPDGRYIAVNYSGDKDDFITIVDIQTFKVLKDIEAGRRIMHLRFSNDGKRLYASSYFENKVKAFDAGTWGLLNEIDVPTPSGIFIVP